MRKTIKGKEYTYAGLNGFRIWVSSDGQYVCRAGADGRAGRPLEILYDYAGAFVLSKDTDGIRIDIAPVILGEFGEPDPGGKGDPYIINWKDGDKHNNDVSNLEWVKPVYRHSKATLAPLWRLRQSGLTTPAVRGEPHGRMRICAGRSICIK